MLISNEYKLKLEEYTDRHQTKDDRLTEFKNKLFSKYNCISNTSADSLFYECQSQAYSFEEIEDLFCRFVKFIQ